MDSKINLYDGLEYTLPSIPSKEKIAGHKKQKKDQRWERNPLPEDWEDWDRAKQEAFAFEEDRRCTEGYWFWNNGIITYITGDHYHYLNWFKIDSGYPDYRDRDRRWFYHWELCDKDEECLGQMYGKLRRDGYSYRVDSIILNRARKTFNAKFGIVSKTGDDAQEMFGKLVHGFMEYPPFFKPQVKSAEDVKKELVFKTPQKKVTFGNRTTQKETSLNTSILWKPTKENSFDGFKLKIVAADEGGKWEVNIEKWFNIGSTCLKLGSRIIGKMFLGSTVNELDNGGEGFKEIWRNSHPSEKTANGRTISGLWRYFLDSADGMEGFIDWYGNSVMKTPAEPVMGIDGKWIVMGAEEWITNELDARKKAGDLVGYYEFKRQFPRTEEDMFIVPANEKTCWDIDKIHQQLEHNKLANVTKEIVWGYFDWLNGNRDCDTVEWHPVEGPSHNLAKHGFVWLPEQPDRNKFKIIGSRKAPANTHVGLFTLDPYAAVNTVDKRRQSKAASHGFKKFDFTAAKNRSEVFIGEYWNRLRDPLLVYEDMIMQCFFFGWALMPERNIKNCNDYFRNRDYHNYLLAPPSMTQEEFNKNLGKEEDAGIANTGGKTQQQLVEYLASYISNHVGQNPKTGEMGYMPFDNTLRDWLEFDINKWTPYDLTVSSMCAVTGSRSFVPKKQQLRRLDLFPKFRIEGNDSVRIE